MVHLHMSDEDATALYEALESYLSELHNEILHTETLAFREELKARERMIKNVLERIEIPVAV